MSITSARRRAQKRLDRQRDRYNTPDRIVYPEHSFGGNKKWEAFANSEATLIALFGGNRSGKTHTNLQRQITKIRNKPGIVTWAATETADMIGQTIWPKFKELTHPAEYGEPAWANKRKQIPAMVPWRNGSQTWFKTYQQGRQSFQAAAVDDILLSEEPADSSIITECIARVGTKGGQVGLDMTPLLGKTWPYYNIDQKANSEYVSSWRVSLFENPFIPQRYKDTLVELYGEDEIDRRVYGLFTILEGAVFKEFDALRHVHSFGRLPASCRKAVGIDLGYDHPFVAIFGAYYDEKLYIFKEYSQSRKLPQTHARVIRDVELDMTYWSGIDFARYEGHPCDWERTTREQLDLEFGRLGHYARTDQAIKDVEGSIQIINRLFKNDRIVISPDCKKLIEGIEANRYKKQRPGSDQKEVVLKEKDDEVDAFKYLTMHFFGGSSFNIAGGGAGSV